MDRTRLSDLFKFVYLADNNGNCNGNDDYDDDDNDDNDDTS